jgi:hypothetical protein
MQHLRNAGLALLVLAVSGSSALAQGMKGKYEVGVDVAGFTSSKDDGATDAMTTIGLNGGTTIRVGKYINDKIIVEPNFSWSHSSQGSGNSSNDMELAVAAVWFLKAMEASTPGWYVRPFVGMNMGKIESGGSTFYDESLVAFGAGFGMARKSMGVNWRIEAFVKMTGEGDAVPSNNSFGIKLGAGVNP